MKKNYQFILGVDVSKKTLDLCLITAGNSSIGEFLHVANNENGYQKMVSWLQSYKFSMGDCIILLEHTGIYSLAVCMFLKKQSFNYSLISGLELKKSLGITRGKDDRKDSFLIARYGYLHRDELQITELKDNTLLQLQVAFSQRKRLVVSLKALQAAVKELKAMGMIELASQTEKSQERSVSALKQEIHELEKKLLAIVESDIRLNEQYKLCTSIPGVGPQLSCYLLIVTGAFTRFENSRTLACFSGVAPFPYQSGTSIRGRNKIHHLADKELKSLLHMASLNAIRGDNQLKEYYIRKKNEGKNGMCVLNAVRNKVLSRVMATVKRGTPYVQLNQHLN